MGDLKWVINICSRSFKLSKLNDKQQINTKLWYVLWIIFYMYKYYIYTGNFDWVNMNVYIYIHMRIEAKWKQKEWSRGNIIGEWITQPYSSVFFNKWISRKSLHRITQIVKCYLLCFRSKRNPTTLVKHCIRMNEPCELCAPFFINIGNHQINE